MTEDLELIIQLEKEIGIELEQLELSEVWEITNNSFSMDENGNVTGLNLAEMKLEKIPLIITKFHLSFVIYFFHFLPSTLLID